MSKNRNISKKSKYQWKMQKYRNIGKKKVNYWNNKIYSLPIKLGKIIFLNHNVSRSNGVRVLATSRGTNRRQNTGCKSLQIRKKTNRYLPRALVMQIISISDFSFCYERRVVLQLLKNQKKLANGVDSNSKLRRNSPFAGSNLKVCLPLK